MDKVSALKKATEEFKHSDHSSDDHLKFAVAISIALKPGDGLLWSDVRDIFDDVIGNDSVSSQPAEQPAEEPHQRRFGKFCDRYNINNVETFCDVLSPMIHEMSDYCHSLPFNERKPYRNIKHAFLKLMYVNGLVTEMYKEISKSPLGKSRTDTLVHMKIRDFTFHIPDRNQDFVNIDSLELHPNIYFRPEARPLNKIDMSFMDHMVIFENMHNETLLRNIGLNMKGFSRCAENN